jgi:nicotinic acid mononucleotide adenylyltransferase
MKTFRQIRESIIDIPRSTYAPLVFDNADTPNPKIKQSVIGMIEKQMEDFEKEYPILKYTLIGSILTKRYRNDADLDINILFDVPEEDREEERTRLSKKYLSASNPDNIQGKLIPGTKHPVNYFFITDKRTYDEQNLKADATFDIKTNKFIKRPDDFTFDVNVYLKDFQKKVDEIDIVKGELKRDIIDYDELSELKPGEIKDLEKRVKGKLDEIETDLQDLIDIGDTVDAERRAAFDKDMSPDEIKTFSIKNRLPKNVVYKMLEKYHYLKFLKKCKMILDDGEVTDAEIDSLRKENTQSVARVVDEALDKGNKLVFAFGRFNPPTIGHDKLMREVITQARKNNANHIVYASASTDKRKNPLDVNTKVKFMKKMFPANKIMAAGGTQRTFIEVLKFYNKMYGEIIMIAGSDRVSEFQKLTDKYNGKEYNYKSIKVVSSGERDPDAEGVAGMSASKMREMAKNGDARSFKKGVPNLSDSDSSSLFNAVRKGMGITGRNYPLIKNSFTEFVNNDLREEYHQEKIFNVGDMIEHLDGTTGMVVRRGSNYVSYENDGLVKKAWLYDIQMSEEQVEKKTNMLDELENEINEEGLDTIIRHLRRFTIDRNRIKAGIQQFKDMVSKGIAKQKALLDASSMIGVPARELRDSLTSAGLFEYFEIGTDEYAKHTMKMTPGQPIQNFRQHSMKVYQDDIEKFANEEETLDKYKKRYGDLWKVELDKAVLRMKKEL